MIFKYTYQDTTYFISYIKRQSKAYPFYFRTSIPLHIILAIKHCFLIQGCIDAQFLYFHIFNIAQELDWQLLDKVQILLKLRLKNLWFYCIFSLYEYINLFLMSINPCFPSYAYQIEPSIICMNV